MIICNTCKKEYEAISETTEQGIDCSADATEDGVIGYYGSTLVDMKICKWSVGKPIHIKNGIICDACIKPLIESKALVLERNYFG
jgi:hypothetical protein